jgi:hypothetical protein
MVSEGLQAQRILVPRMKIAAYSVTAAWFLFMLLALGGCTGMSDKHLTDEPGPGVKSDPQEGSIRVAVCEYMVQTLLNLPADFPIFAQLTDAERDEVAARLPDHRILPLSRGTYVRGIGVREKTTRRRGGDCGSLDTHPRRQCFGHWHLYHLRRGDVSVHTRERSAMEGDNRDPLQDRRSGVIAIAFCTPIGAKTCQSMIM